MKDRPSFTTARSEIGTMATSTQGSTTTTLAKAAWRNRNITATPTCASTSLRAESLNDTTMATATPPSHITDTNSTHSVYNSMEDAFTRNEASAAAAARGQSS